jgi:ferredoxin-type protein NapH
MTNVLYNHRFLISRRLVQIGLLILFFGGNYFGWKILAGNYSSATAFGEINFSDPFALLQTLFSGFIVATDALIGGLVILVLYSLIVGRAFCSWVCPMNIVVDMAGWVNRKVGFSKPKIDFNKLAKLRYYVFGLVLLLSAILGFAVFEMISPIGILHRNIIFGVGTGIIAVVAIFLFDMVARPLSFCHHICPLGAFYSLVSRYRVLKVYHKVEACTKCNKCFKVCPEKQVLSIIGKRSGNIVSGECTNCGRCIEVCDDKALKFSILKK